MSSEFTSERLKNLFSNKRSRITSDQIFELLKKSRQGLLSRQHLEAFLANPHSVFGEPAVYPVIVDYSMSLDDMIAAGQYDEWDDRINVKNFPVANEGFVGTALAEIELIHFNVVNLKNKVMTTDEIKAYLEEKGLRPATLVELLAFGARYPHIQMEFPLIALGSTWVTRFGPRLVPGLNPHWSERHLSLGLDHNNWNLNWRTYRFPASRKSNLRPLDPLF